MSFIHTIERTRTNTPQGAHSPGSIIHKKLLMQNRDNHPGTPRGHRDQWSRFTRCSRPLCSSQTTNPSHPPPHEHPPAKGGREPCGLGHARDNPGQTRPNPHTPHRACTGTGACCSRTQQCAKRPSTGRIHPLPTRKRAYWEQKHHMNSRCLSIFHP
jgi:hypothetical protein